jgi:hypothetical protein
MTVSDIASILILLCVNYINSFSYKIWSVSIPFKCLKFASYLKKNKFDEVYFQISFFFPVILGREEVEVSLLETRPPKYFIKKELEIEKSGEKNKNNLYFFVSSFLY